MNHAAHNLDEWKRSLSSLPPADVAAVLEPLTDRELVIGFRLLPLALAVEVFEYLESEVQERLIHALHRSEVHDLLEEMSPDDRVKLFDELPLKVRRRLFLELSPAERNATALLLGYAEGTAGRVMTPEFVSLDERLTVGEALSQITVEEADKETIYYAYVTTPSGHLVGAVTLRELMYSRPELPLSTIATPEVVRVSTGMSQQQAAELMKRYDLLALPVVDRNDHILGIVTVDDCVDILEEEATAVMHRLAGVSGEDTGASATPGDITRSRLPWLALNILLYVGAASAIAPFKGIISAAPVLAVIMPILSNTSGNVGIQALTVTVRALGTGEIGERDVVGVARREVAGALVSAIVLGTMLAGLSLIWSTGPERWVAVIAGSVMSINVLVAVTVGSVLPITLKRLGQDPALISGPLLTTLLDTVGFFTFLGMASIMLRG